MSPRIAAIVLSMAVLSMALAESAAEAQPAGELPVAGLAVTFGAQGGKARVAVFLAVPGEELVRAPAAPAGRLEVTARVRLADAAGAQVDHFEVAASIDLEEDGGRLAASSLKIYGDLSATPGSHRLSFEIRAGDRRGSRELPLDVPATEKDRPRLLPPLFIDDIGAAVVIYEDGGDSPPEDYPFVIDETEVFVPEIVPSVSEDTPRSRVALFGYHLTAEKMLVDTGLIAADGTFLGKERLQLVGRTETDSGGLDRLYFGLDTQGLPAGDYQLNVSLHDLGRGRTEQTAMPFSLLPAGSSPGVSR